MNGRGQTLHPAPGCSPCPWNEDPTSGARGEVFARPLRSACCAPIHTPMFPATLSHKTGNDCIFLECLGTGSDTETVSHSHTTGKHYRAESFKLQKKKNSPQNQLMQLSPTETHGGGKCACFCFAGGFDSDNAPQNSVQERGFVLLLIKVKLLSDV